jgi:hypothetical protein
MTDIERVELAVRRTAVRIYENGDAPSAIKIWLLELARELARITREAQVR